MRTRNELAIIAANASDDVVSIQCVPASKDGVIYTYKAPLSLARTLHVDDFVLVEGDREKQHTKGGRVPFRVMRVRSVDDVCMLDDMSIVYKWAFHKIDVTSLHSLLGWEEDVVRQLQDAQRRRARKAMLDELGADGADLPVLPAPVRDETASEAAVVIDEAEQVESSS